MKHVFTNSEETDKVSNTAVSAISGSQCWLQWRRLKDSDLLIVDGSDKDTNGTMKMMKILIIWMKLTLFSTGDMKANLFYFLSWLLYLTSLWLEPNIWLSADLICSLSWWFLSKLKCKKTHNKYFWIMFQSSNWWQFQFLIVFTVFSLVRNFAGCSHQFNQSQP